MGEYFINKKYEYYPLTEIPGSATGECDAIAAVLYAYAYWVVCFQSVLCLCLDLTSPLHIGLGVCC